MNIFLWPRNCTELFNGHEDGCAAMCRANTMGGLENGFVGLTLIFLFVLLGSGEKYSSASIFTNKFSRLPPHSLQPMFLSIGYRRMSHPDETGFLSKAPY